MFGVDEKTGEVLLVMNEPSPWDGGHEQLHEMQEKFNTYVSFILDGEMDRMYSEWLVALPDRTALLLQMPNEEALGVTEKRSTTFLNDKRLEWKQRWPIVAATINVAVILDECEGPFN